MRAATPSGAVLAALLSTSAACRGCSGEAISVSAEVSGRPGLVTLEERSARHDPAQGQLVWRGVAGVEGDRALIDLAVTIEATRADGTTAGTRRLDVVGTRGLQAILVPGYRAPIEIALPLDETPAHVAVRVERAEAFSQPADTPLDLNGTGAERERLRFQSLGHFRLQGEGNRLPFRLSLGIRNVGDRSIDTLEYQVVLKDERGRDADRVPGKRTFVPPLAPGDAVIEEVNHPVLPFTTIEVEARAVTPAPG